MSNLAVAAILVSGLLLAAGTFLEDRQHASTHNEIQVIGDRVANDLEAADRLSRTNATDVVVTVDLPARVLNEPYRVHVTNSSVVVSTASSSESVTVPVSLEVGVETVTVAGGDLRITYDGTGSVVVQRA